MIRSPEDQQTGRLIELLLCQGEALLGQELLQASHAALEPFIRRGLAQVTGNLLQILPDGLPYTRTIAAQFDPYRQHSQRRFSSAV